jgi:hypothetical protein
MHRNAYNAAFYELGLRWHWDADTYQNLQANDNESDRIRVYLESEQPHLLKAYDANFLIEAIQATKARCFNNLTVLGAENVSTINWGEIHGLEVGI